MKARVLLGCGVGVLLAIVGAVAVAKSGGASLRGDLTGTWKGSGTFRHFDAASKDLGWRDQIPVHATIEQTDSSATILLQFEILGDPIEGPLSYSVSLAGAAGSGHLWGIQTSDYWTSVVSADVGPGGKVMRGVLIEGSGDTSQFARFTIVREEP